MKRVVIESPLSGNFSRNVRYARLCLIDCLRRGEAGYASHLIYTQILDDARPEDRALGMAAGFAWNEAAELAAVYLDLGPPSRGMLAGIETHRARGTPIEERKLPADLMAELDAVGANVRPTEGIGA